MERVEESNRFATTLVSCHVLAPGILEVHMRRPAGFNFLPGQFLRVIMDDYQRDYTIVSGSDAETLDFCIAMVAGGVFPMPWARQKKGIRFDSPAPMATLSSRDRPTRRCLLPRVRGWLLLWPFAATVRATRYCFTV